MHFKIEKYFSKNIITWFLVYFDPNSSAGTSDLTKCIPYSFYIKLSTKFSYECCNFESLMHINMLN